MRIGVTGANGFIGKRLIEMGLSQGIEMVAFVRSATKMGDELISKIKIFEGDISIKNSLIDFVNYCDIIIHSAAVVSDWAPKAEYQKVTIDGTKHVLDLMIGSDKKIVLISSIAVYADNLWTEKCIESLDFTAPTGNYTWAKQEQEKLVVSYGKVHHLKYAIVRPGNIFGPYSQPWVHEFLSAMKSGPILIGGGQAKALTYIDNVSDLILLAAINAKAEGQIYNGTDDPTISWQEYANEIAKTLNLPKPKSLPLAMAKVLGKVLPAVSKLLKSRSRPLLTHEAVTFVAAPCDIPYRKAHIDLGYSPKVEKREALQKTMAYISNHASEF